VSGLVHRPSFFREALLGLALSIVAAALSSTLSLVVDSEIAMRATIGLLGLAYVLYRLNHSNERCGRIVTIALWAALTGCAWLFAPTLATFLVIQITLMWLIRSLYAYSSLLSAAADLGLTVLSLAVAVWALLRADSVFLAAWCFFLIQALHTAIPVTLEQQRPRASSDDLHEPDDDAFLRAHHTAESALRRLIPGR